MKIVGCDLHAKQPTIAMVDTDRGELIERTLSHEGNAVREFYAAWESAGSGGHGSDRIHAMVFGTTGRVGDRLSSRPSDEGPGGRDARKQKHDRRDAGLILDLLTMEDRFPAIWMPSTEPRDLRTLLRDHHPWVKIRSRLQHRLQAIARNHALRQGHALWSAAGQSALRALPLPPYTSQRRNELLRWYAQMQKRIQELDQQELDQEVEAQARPRPKAPVADASGRDRQLWGLRIHCWSLNIG